MKTILAAVLALTALPAAAQMYKCVDERGVTHYSDKPQPPGCKGGPVDIKGSPPISGSLKPPPAAEDLARQSADFRRRQIEREQIEASDRTALEERCARLRHEHTVLASGIRLFKLNSQGEREYYEDQTRDARLQKLKEELRTCP